MTPGPRRAAFDRADAGALATLAAAAAPAGAAGEARPRPLCESRAAVTAVLVAQAILFPLSIAGLYWFLLWGA